MKTIFAILLTLSFCIPAHSQNKAVVRFDATVECNCPDGDKVIANKLVDDGNTLLMVGQKTIRRLDLVSNKMSPPIPINLSDSLQDNKPVISPDGNKILVFGNYRSYEKIDKIKHPPAVWDLLTGKQIAVLDRGKKQIVSGYWSSNGKTLVTITDNRIAYFHARPIEVSFWDGETLSFKNSLPSDKVFWFHLLDDGSKCFYTIGQKASLLLISKYIDSAGGPVNVWNINDAKTEMSSPDGGTGTNQKIGDIQVSPDETLLLMTLVAANSNQPENGVEVWDIDKSVPTNYKFKLKFEIKLPPLKPPARLSFNPDKIRGLSLSPDKNLISLFVDKNLQIFGTKTGEKKFDLANIKDGMPIWIDHDKTLVFNYDDHMVALATNTGTKVYDRKIDFFELTNTDADGYQYGEVVDNTTLLLNNTGNLMLTFSKGRVEIINPVTGELLQDISPVKTYTDPQGRTFNMSSVETANWTVDGNAIFIISLDGRSVYLWRVVHT